MERTEVKHRLFVVGITYIVVVGFVLNLIGAQANSTSFENDCSPQRLLVGWMLSCSLSGLNFYLLYLLPQTLALFCVFCSLVMGKSKRPILYSVLIIAAAAQWLYFGVYRPELVIAHHNGFAWIVLLVLVLSLGGGVFRRIQWTELDRLFGCMYLFFVTMSLLAPTVGQLLKTHPQRNDLRERREFALQMLDGNRIYDLKVKLVEVPRIPSYLLIQLEFKTRRPISTDNTLRAVVKFHDAVLDLVQDVSGSSTDNEEIQEYRIVMRPAEIFSHSVDWSRICLWNESFLQKKREPPSAEQGFINFTWYIYPGCSTYSKCSYQNHSFGEILTLEVFAGFASLFEDSSLWKETFVGLSHTTLLKRGYEVSSPRDGETGYNITCYQQSQ